jgi:hypothetical protein
VNAVSKVDATTRPLDDEAIDANHGNPELWVVNKNVAFILCQTLRRDNLHTVVINAGN